MKLIKKIIIIVLLIFFIVLVRQLLIPKTLTITIDAEGTDIQIQNLLDLFESENITATFFVVGETCETHPILCRKIAEEHEIACHTYSHPNLKLLSEDEQQEEILKGKEIIMNITGVNCIGFRSPYYYHSKELSEFTDKEFLYTSNWPVIPKAKNIKPTWGDYIRVYKWLGIDLSKFKYNLNIKQHTLIVIHPHKTGASQEKLDELRAFIEYAKSKNIEIITMRELAEIKYESLLHL